MGHLRLRFLWSSENLSMFFCGLAFMTCLCNVRTFWLKNPSVVSETRIWHGSAVEPDSFSDGSLELELPLLWLEPLKPVSKNIELVLQRQVSYISIINPVVPS